MAKTTAAKTIKQETGDQLDQLKENAATTLNEAMQITASAIERLEGQATAATEAVQKNVEGLQVEVASRVNFAKEHINGTKENVTELFNTLKGEITQTFNDLIGDAQGTFSEVKDVLLKAKADALIKLEDSKKTTLEAWQQFKQ